MNVLSLVVFYNPQGNIIERLKAISCQVDKVIIYDNSEDENIIKNNLSIIEQFNNIEYFGDGVNKGIGEALNYGVKYAIEQGFKYYLTFDQDTLIPDDYVSILMESYNKESNIGVVGPIYNDVNSGRESKFPVKYGPLILRKTLSGESKIQDVMSLISSGSLYSVNTFIKVGDFRSDYFIDYVDNEFCLRIIHSGLRVCVDPRIKINHALGNRTNKGVLIKFSPTNYPFYRKYYITRNRFYVHKEYFLKFPAFFFYDMLAFLLDFTRVIFFEKNKTIKLKAYYFGVKDFLGGVKGKLDFKKIKKE